MIKPHRLYKKLLTIRPIRELIGFSHKHSIPGFEGISIYSVAKAFIYGVTEESVTDRAAAITFKFFMAMFPLLLFFCTLIPIIPIEGLQEKLLQTYTELMPDQVAALLNDAITQAITNPNGGLLSLSFISALFFSSNGVVGLIKAMNDSAHLRETRSGGGRRLAAMFILSIVFFMSLLAVGFTVVSSWLIQWLAENGLVAISATFWLNFVKFVILYLILFVTISTIYYLAPAKALRKKFISPGAILATNVSILASYLLTIFFQNFDNYNKIYGAIGSIPILMLWIFINSLVLLIGFELNVSITVTKRNKKKTSYRVLKRP